MVSLQVTALIYNEVTEQPWNWARLVAEPPQGLPFISKSGLGGCQPSDPGLVLTAGDTARLAAPTFPT